MVDLFNALKVDGWMNNFELEWLASQAQHKVVAEIGCWMGRTTRALADSPASQVFAIDTWRGSEENQEFLKDKPPNFLYDTFCENLQPHITQGRVIPVRLPSLEAAYMAKLLGQEFDFVFIDASHDYLNVKADILAWRPLVKPGGTLSGHDYDLGWPGVVHAVRELISPTPNQFQGTSIWYTQC